ncbi:MAG: aminotransferase class V-fold PLP-dependent enzyme [Flavobacterium sp.]
MLATAETSQLEVFFNTFRKQIIGIDTTFESPYGTQKIIYTDWTASGRLYAPIEDKISRLLGPYVANTHTETSETGTAMTLAYNQARKIIKNHVNANENDILITDGTGMTGVVNKLQRILGLRIAENLKEYTAIPEAIKPVVFISHMEHHSNQTSWLETIAKVIVIPADDNGLFSLENLQTLLLAHENSVFKIASITSCSNVTGIKTPYYEVAKLMHAHQGVCFVDFACSGPYVSIDMHPNHDQEAYLDAIFFSPHKFLGGPGTSGVLVFNKNLYKNNVPDCPGGGTVSWTNPWGEHQYITNIEEREDGGTPGFLQAIKTAFAIQLKEKMGVVNILKREKELTNYIFETLGNIPNLHILAPEHQNRLGVVSFYIDDLHYNLGVKLLNDKFGIQTRGGCSCAGTYGHFLLHVNQETSKELVCSISSGDLSKKPGWIRMSIHPTTTNAEIEFVCQSVQALAEHYKNWQKDYVYQPEKNDFKHHSFQSNTAQMVSNWFE